MNRLRHKATVASACVAVVLLAAPFVHTSRARAQGVTREFTISGDHFAFAPVRLEVQKDDLVKIVFTARDIAHSFTIDQYRIAKRAARDNRRVRIPRRPCRHPPLHCNLTQDDRCRKMEGALVVR